ncbi:hypothetical protein F9K50_05485, partial [bacterium]
MSDIKELLIKPSGVRLSLSLAVRKANFLVKNFSQISFACWARRFYFAAALYSASNISSNGGQALHEPGASKVPGIPHAPNKEVHPFDAKILLLLKPYTPSAKGQGATPYIDLGRQFLVGLLTLNEKKTPLSRTSL